MTNMAERKRINRGKKEGRKRPGNFRGDEVKRGNYSRERGVRSYPIDEDVLSRKGWGNTGVVGESASMFDLKTSTYVITRGGKERAISVRSGYGFFIPSFKKATSIQQINTVVEAGLPSKELEEIVQYLGLKTSEIARAADVSVSTVSRWEPDTRIGVSGSSQFFRIDEVIRKGVDVFGGLDEFSAWLRSPNLALGNVLPSTLLQSQIGVELVDEALDALHFGSVM